MLNDNRKCLCQTVTDKDGVKHTFACPKCTDELIDTSHLITEETTAKETVSGVFGLECIEGR